MRTSSLVATWKVEVIFSFKLFSALQIINYGKYFCPFEKNTIGDENLHKIFNNFIHLGSRFKFLSTLR
jgi:hypothetical protein